MTRAGASPHLRGRDVVCLAGLFGGVALAMGLRFATPSLLKNHPVLLEALTGSVAAAVTGGAYARVGRVALPLVVLAPLVAIAIYDGFAWWAGRLWGSRVIDLYTQQRSARFRRRVIRFEGWIRRRGVLALAVAYFLPVPNFVVYLMCGASGMSLGLFVVGDAIGTVLWNGLLAGLGWSAGRSAIRVVDTINHDALVITLALVGASLLAGIWRARRVGPPGNPLPVDVDSREARPSER